MIDKDCIPSASHYVPYQEINIDNHRFKETGGKNGLTRIYQCTRTRVAKISKIGAASSLRHYFRDLFKQVFLPVGFPDSVSDDYTSYQIWDTLQAFCSTITGTFTTKSILKTVGVGDISATALSAAITWIIKDGAGMGGRILFAWMHGKSLDADCKYWRLFADILNDVALSIEFLIPYLHLKSSMYILCITSTMKSIVGVAGGATRAAITQHQAQRGNMADVLAKDGSQETCVNLVASICGLYLLTACESNQSCALLIFFCLTILHIYANYCAVRSLVFNTLNVNRFNIVFNSYLTHDAVSKPSVVNKEEALILRPSRTDMCSLQIVMGESLQSAFKQLTASEYKTLIGAFSGKPYIIVPCLNGNTLSVGYEGNVGSEVILKAYFHASMLGIALSLYNHVASIKTKKHLHHVPPIQRLVKLMKNIEKSPNNQLEIFPLEKFRLFNDFINTEALSFTTALCVNNWDLSSNSLPVGEWVSNWNTNIPSNVTNKFD